MYNAAFYGVELPRDVPASRQVSELFYRLQFSQGIAITPGIRLLIDPANNLFKDKIWVAGIRARIIL